MKSPSPCKTKAYCCLQVVRALVGDQVCKQSARAVKTSEGKTSKGASRLAKTKWRSSLKQAPTSPTCFSVYVHLQQSRGLQRVCRLLCRVHLSKHRRGHYIRCSWFSVLPPVRADRFMIVGIKYTFRSPVGRETSASAPRTTQCSTNQIFRAWAEVQ